MITLHPFEDYSAQTQKAIKTFHSIFDQKKKWPLTNGKWQRLKLPTVLPFVKSTLVQQVELSNNKQPKILHSLSNVQSFDNLKILNLSNNKITSIQPLVWMEFPLIQQLVLTDNEITHLKVLNKFNIKWQKVKQLKICKYFFILMTDANRVQSIDILGKINFIPLSTQKEKYQNKSIFQQSLLDQEINLIFGINQISSFNETNKIQTKKIKRQSNELFIDKISNSSQTIYQKKLFLAVENNRLIFSKKYPFHRIALDKKSFYI